MHDIFAIGSATQLYSLDTDDSHQRPLHSYFLSSIQEPTHGHACMKAGATLVRLPCVLVCIPCFERVDFVSAKEL